MLRSCSYCGRIHDSKYKCADKPVRKKQITEALNMGENVIIGYTQVDNTNTIISKRITNIFKDISRH